VDAVARAEDVALHLRVPALRLVAEVNAGLHHLADRDRLVDGVLELFAQAFGLQFVAHWFFPFALLPPPASAGTETEDRRKSSAGGTRGPLNGRV
jgi:hypothetical protein